MAVVSAEGSITVVCFVPGEIELCILTKFNLLNTDTPLIQTLSMSPSEPVLK